MTEKQDDDRGTVPTVSSARPATTKQLSLPGDLSLPTLLIDPYVISNRYEELSAGLPTGAGIRYPVACNPAPTVLRALAGSGCIFGVTTQDELELLSGVGIDIQNARFTVPFRASNDIRAASHVDVSWTVASEAELQRLSRLAPGSEVSVLVDARRGTSEGAGELAAGREDAIRASEVAAQLGLAATSLELVIPTVTSELQQWADEVDQVRTACSAAQRDQRPIDLVLSSVSRPVCSVEWLFEVAATLSHQSGVGGITAEFGSPLVGAAGTLVAEVTGISTRRDRRWIFLGVEPFLNEDGDPEGLKSEVLAAGTNREPGADEPSTIACATAWGEMVIATDVSLPASVEPGDALGISGAGAAFPQTQQLLNVRDTERSEVGGEHITLRDRNVYRVAWPGSEMFDECRHLEQIWFEMSGFVEADGLEGFHKYDPASTFLAVQGPSGDIQSTMRLIWSSPLGFKTLNDLELSGEGERLVSAIPERSMAEVGTISTHPAARSMGPTFRIFFALNDVMVRRNMTHFISAIDDGLLHVMRGEPTRFPMQNLGPSSFYYGAPSTPVIMDVAAYRRQLYESDHGLYRRLIEGRFSTAVDA